MENIILVDSHCHLNDEGFEGMDVGDMLMRAKGVGIQYVVSINTRLDELQAIQNIVKKHDHVFYSAGIHPHHADTFNKQNFPIENWMQDPKWVGLGETGLDYYYDNAPREEQKTSFRHHLEMACKYDVPVIVHTRSADEDTVKVIDEFPGVRGVIHCFSGSAGLAKETLARGFYLSFSGIITFKKAEELRQVVRDTPISRILVETDAPYLAPVPYRGKTNEPMHTRINAENVAALKGLELAKVAELTTQNFQALFTRAQLG